MWAPWRIEYVTGPKSGECPFCEAAAGHHPDADLVVARGGSCFVMLNRFPYASGHLMVLPLRHIASLLDLHPDEQTEVMRLTQLAIQALTEVMGPEGFNVGLNLGRAAGAGVDEHLHQHVVPRWAGDTNFMPVLADVNVVPEALRATRQRLVQAWPRPKRLIGDQPG